MLIKTPKPSGCNESDVTPEAVYRQRRRIMQGALYGLASAALPAFGGGELSLYPDVERVVEPKWLSSRLEGVHWGAVVPAGEAITPYRDATHYNNFYEFGPDKEDPARYADRLTVEPWVVTVDGEVARPGQYDIDSLLGAIPLEERIYRLRCVEAWSMVIPWLGFPLAALINRLEPASAARFVRFETALRPEEMRGARSIFSLIDWPYVEGLRIDEAMHPLTILAVGMYGRVLPNQNGAPLRLVVPWKYGFKSIKSIVRISFLREQPKTTWQTLAPEEYGFYANVNPSVSHPRWSQATERRLPGRLFSPNVRDTVIFNGYAEQVADLYVGMDLARDY